MLRTWRARATVLTAAIAIMLAAAGAAQAATLSGTVRSQAGSGSTPTALAGAAVYVSDARAGYFDRAQTDLLGGYSFLLPDGTYDVEVVAGGYESVRRDAVAVNRSAQLDVTLVPTGYGLVSGRFTDGAGAPLASVRLGASNSTGSYGYAATDANGRYSFAMPQGVVTLHAVGGRWNVDQWGLSDVVAELDSERTLDVRLPPRAPLTVRVIGQDDQPIPDSHVTVQRLSRTLELSDGTVGALRIWEREGDTDADGEFTVMVFDRSGPNGPTGYAGVYVWPTKTSEHDEAFVAAPFVDGPTEFVVRPERAAYLTLSLRDGDGAPVSAAAVSVGDRWGSETAAGEYEARSPLGTQALKIDVLDSDVGWTYRGEPFELPASTAGTLRLPARQPAVVRVVDEQGDPVANATVTAPQMVQPLASTLAGGTLRTQGQSAVTDRDGYVQLDAFAGGSTDPEALGTVVPQGVRLAPGSFSVADGRATVVLRRTPPVEVTGSLIDAAGAPVAGAEVAVAGRPVTTTAADGAFAFAAEDGSSPMLSVTHGNWSLVVGIFVGTDRTLPMQLPPRVPLTVRTRNVLGGPIAGATVVPPSASMQHRFGFGRAQITTTFQPALSNVSGEAGFETFAGSRAAGEGQVAPPRGSAYEAATFTLPLLSAATLVDVQMRGPADSDPPAIACDPAPSGWQSGNIAIACTASDAGSGLADPRSDAAFTLTTAVGEGGEDARALTGTRQVCDVAGNCATAGPLGPVAVDRAAPSIALAVVPDPLVRGDWWTVSRVAVQVLASDAGAGIGTLACSVDGVTKTFAQTRTAATIAGTFYVNGEGRHVAACSATDRLGRVGTTDRAVNLDLKNPAAPTLTADRPADEPVSGWYRDTVTVSFADNGDPLLADGSAGSGVDSGSVPAPQTFATSGTHRASGTVSDVAGRVSASRALTVKVDADAPTSTLTCPAAPVTFGANASARWQDADGQAGLDGASGGTIALDTTSVGGRSVSHRAFDRVGHVTVSSCRYVVVYPFLWRGGLAAAPALNAIAPGVRTQTVWFSIGGDHGLGIVASGWPQVQPVDCSDGTPSGGASAATTSAPLTWDVGTGRYGIAWEAAADLPSGSCAALRVVLDDSRVREVLFAR